MTNENCEHCNYCYCCNSCDYCYYCYYCDYCNSCYYCYYCCNLRMTERNLFCYSEKYNDKNSFQQNRWRAFNKEVGKSRYMEILALVQQIIPSKGVPLDEFWESVTQDQWELLLAIPEAKGFEEGFEYISGVEITKQHTITIDGKVIHISKDSYEALKKELKEN